MALVLDLNRGFNSLKSFIGNFFKLYKDDDTEDDKYLANFGYAMLTFYGITLSASLRTKSTDNDINFLKAVFLPTLIPVFGFTLYNPKCILPILLGTIVDRNVTYW
jgi:arginine exporter protein ArgO